MRGKPAPSEPVPVDAPRPTAEAIRPNRIWADGLGRVSIRCLQIIIIVVLAIGVIYAGLQLEVVVIPVIIALILAAAVAPLVHLLVRMHVPKALSTVIAMVLGLGVLGGVLAAVTLAVVNQSGELVDATTKGIGQLQTFLSDAGIRIQAAQIDKARTTALSYLTSGSFGSSALAGISAAGSVATGLFLVIVVLFFFLKDGAMIWGFLLQPLHPVQRARAERIGSRSVRVLGAYVRGTALVALVDTVFIGAGLLILGVPLAVPLSVFVFVTAFIPVVGATLAGVVAALVALVTGGPVTALVVIIIVIIVNQLEGNLLQPLIMGRSLSLHPLVILLALTAGTILGGVLGAILAVPTASVIWTAIRSWSR